MSLKPHRRLSRRYSVVLTLLLAGAAACGPGHAALTATLQGYQVDLSQTSVSGLSSGAFMAGQFATAYSATVVGAGIVAGGPYYCAGYPGTPPFISYVTNAMTSCMNPGTSTGIPPSGAASWNAAESFAQAGLIDPVGGLARQRIYLFSGKADQTVITQVVNQTAQFYKEAGVPANNIAYITDINAGHALITALNSYQKCPLTATPYINDCDFTQSQDILEFIYTGLKPPAKTLSGKIVAFNQTSFVKSSISSMATTAYAYVPKSCDSQTCKVHVAFHGCEQGATVIGNQYYTKTGYNELADTNNIIVLYPQVDPSPFYPFNPKGCWDFWGYSDFNPFLPAFYTRNAVQMAAVKAMLDRLAAPRSQKF